VATLTIILSLVCFMPMVQIHASDSWQPLPSGTVQRIAFGSCAKQWQHQTIWDAVLAQKPDIWLFLGDNIYGDTDGTTAWLVSKEQMTGEWNRLADKPEFQKARANHPHDGNLGQS
jgi:alkaline phosphatase D